MKLATLAKFSPALILTLALCGNVAKANPLITGGLNFDGLVTVNTGSLGTATAFSSIYDVYVFPGSTGSYAAIPPFAGPVTFTPFSFSAPGVTPLWTFTLGSVTYSFDASTINVVAQSSGGLLLEGKGWAHITGYASTAGTWSIDDTSVLGGPKGIFNFGADSASIPDSGGTALLIGLGLAGVGAGMVAQRRRHTKA